MGHFLKETPLNFTYSHSVTTFKQACGMITVLKVKAGVTHDLMQISKQYNPLMYRLNLGGDGRCWEDFLEALAQLQR